MQNKINNLIVVSVLATFLTACATTEIIDERDPWESWNRSIHSFNEGLDDYAMKPVAKGYRWITPTIVDTAITNVFNNIDDIGVTANDALQGKFMQSGLDFSRFIVNSTAGVGGLIDVASMIDLPKHDEDFGQTLGVWGVPTGPYMVLPFFGPSSPRGVVGLAGDIAMDPTSYLAPYISTAIHAVNAIDRRADYLGTEKMADEASVFGKYEFYRNSYIEQRQLLVLDGVELEGEDLLLEYE